MSLKANIEAGFTRLTAAVVNLKNIVDGIDGVVPTVITDTKSAPVGADTLIMFDSAAASNPVLVTKTNLLADVNAAIGDVESVLAGL